MPTYDYKCQTCEHEGEVRMRIADLDLPENVDAICPECGAATFRRNWSAPVSHEYMTPEGLGRVKAPGDFRDMLSQIKKGNPGSVIRDR